MNASVDELSALPEDDLDRVEGLVDALTPWGATGWAWIPAAPHLSLQIEAVLDGRVIGRGVADRIRGDLTECGKGTGRYGFLITFDGELAHGSAPLLRALGPRGATVLSACDWSRIEGHIDRLTRSGALGWAWMPEEPDRIMQVEAVLDGRVIGWAQADQMRPDIAESGRGSGRYGFVLSFDVTITEDSLPQLRVLGSGETAILRSPNKLAPEHVEEAPAPLAIAPNSSLPLGRGSAQPIERPIPVEGEGGVNSRLDESPFEETRRNHITLLSASGVFQLEWYKTANPDLASPDIDPIAHYYDHGSLELRRPNPYFDPQWYLNRYPDVAEAKMLPLLHYVLHGEAENRQPSPLFNPAWYRAKFSPPEGQLALVHYLENCRTGTVSPIPEFDIEYYAKRHPDVIAAGVDPFHHFINYGYREGRAPSEAFDCRWYATRYLNGDLSRNPFLHWLENHDKPGVYGKMPAHETNIPREVKRFTRASEEFEEFKPLPPSAPRQAKVLAFYLPQFHSFPENDEWWGKGFTEWTNLARGLPRFKGHYQPRVPRDLGFYNLNERDGTETMRRQARMAQDAGLFGFVFYYYWFNGKRLLHAPLERLLRDPSIDFPFALMWANENWTRRWDGAESAVLISQDYRPEDDEEMLVDFVRHFRDKRYIRIGGRPLLMVYRPGIIPGGKETIERWRTICRQKLNEDPLILMTQSFGDVDPRVFGLDGAVEFPPHKFCQHLRPINDKIDMLDPEFEGQIHNYDAVAKMSLDEPTPDFPLIKTLVPSWDNDARRQGAGLVITGSTPAKYQAWLAELVARARKVPFFNESLVLINAWNEWCEGTYLEPDLHFGAAYLNATGRAVAGLSSENALRCRLLLVGHDAFPSGAQHLLLNIGTMLLRRYGMRIEFMLLDGGKLENKYRALAPTKVLIGGAGLEIALAEYASRGITRALINTSVTGCAAPLLEAHGIVPEVMLVHELPRILREKGLISNIRSGFQFARNLVFPAKFVQSAVTELVGEAPVGNAVVIPQGSYKILSANDDEIANFLAALGVSTEPMVLGVGYADMRKGFDLFLQTWRLANRNRRVHFCWAGALAPELETWLTDEISAAKATGTFHLPGNLENMAPAFAASKALLLTSREDPFPTVALEALSLGKPVIAFAESGGIPELLSNTDTGFVVPYADTVAMAEVIEKLLADTESEETVKARQALIRDQYSFATYVGRLVSIAMPAMPKISVAVPNYNYARYMPERLASIFRQTHPVHEILVLDDCSKDDSLEVIRRIAVEWGRDIQLVANKTNSGSVFKQWQKAAELSTGDWLWIAEADDDSDPDFLTRLMATVDNDPNVVLAFSDSRTMTANGSPQWESYKSYYAMLEKGALTQTKIFEGSEFVSRYLSIKNLILNVSAVVWRRDALRSALDSCGAALLEYKMAGDWHLYLEALSTPGAKVAYESDPLNIHRRHEQSVTHALDAERHVAEIKRCHDFARQKFPNLSKGSNKAQKDYLNEVTRQLGARKITKVPGKQPRVVRARRK